MGLRAGSSTGAGVDPAEALRAFLACPPPPDRFAHVEPAEAVLPGLLAGVSPADAAFVFSQVPLAATVPFPVAVAALAAQTYARRGALQVSSPPRLGCGVPAAPDGFALLQSLARAYRQVSDPSPAVFAGFLAWQVPPVELVALTQRCPPLASASTAGVLARARLSVPPQVAGVARLVLLAGVLSGAFAVTVLLLSRPG